MLRSSSLEDLREEGIPILENSAAMEAAKTPAGSLSGPKTLDAGDYPEVDLATTMAEYISVEGLG